MNEIETMFSDIVEYKKGLSYNDIIVDKSYLQDVHNNNVYNKIILNYYKKLIHEDSRISKSVISRIEQCNKYFAVNRYDCHMVKDFISTNLCHDKFCNNCKKVKQASRMSRYISELEPYSDNLYHITFTLPNVSGNDLYKTLRKMSKSFSKLMRYIDCTKKLSFLNFSKYGYLGSVRSLEITFKGDSYHPHYHCAFAFTNLKLEQSIENVYSHDFNGFKDLRLFSEFEIILQKLWYMCLNDIPVTVFNYNNLNLGYSVLCNKFANNDYAELFKYMTKETDEINNILTYENFKALYYATKSLKQIQGYGVFYRISDSDLNDEVDTYYNDLVYYLSDLESPVLQLDKPFDLLNDNVYTLISRKKVYQYIRELDKK